MQGPLVPGIVQRILQRDSLHKLTAQERVAVFESRAGLREIPSALPRFLSSVRWFNRRQAEEAREQVYQWARPGASEAGALMEVLGRPHADQQARHAATSAMALLSPPELAAVLPQLTQALKQELHPSSSLALLLLTRALEHPLDVGVPLYWATAVEAGCNPLSHCRFAQLQRALLFSVPRFLADLVTSQARLWGDGGLFAQLIYRVKAYKKRGNSKAQVNSYLQEEVAKVRDELPERLILPLDTRMEVGRLVPSECRVMDSAKLPIWLSFEAADGDDEEDDDEGDVALCTQGEPGWGGSATADAARLFGTDVDGMLHPGARQDPAGLAVGPLIDEWLGRSEGPARGSDSAAPACGSDDDSAGVVGIAHHKLHGQSPAKVDSEGAQGDAADDASAFDDFTGIAMDDGLESDTDSDGSVLTEPDASLRTAFTVSSVTGVTMAVSKLAVRLARIRAAAAAEDDEVAAAEAQAPPLTDASPPLRRQRSGSFDAGVSPFRANPIRRRLAKEADDEAAAARPDTPPAQRKRRRTRIIFKAGDDIRQDTLTLQILEAFDRAWRAEGLDLCMTLYRCVPTWEDGGLVEIVPNSRTTADIQKRQGGRTGAFKNTVFLDWIASNNGPPGTPGHAAAIDRFIRSAAGYCVASYVLGLGDRHNDNIMLTESGKFFHIDFGHFLGNWKYQFGILRERTAFVLTPEMATAMAGEPVPSRQLRDTPGFRRFRRLCDRAFVILRKHAGQLMALFSLMVPAGMPELRNADDIHYMRDKLALHLSDEEACGVFQAEADNALGSWFKRLDNTLHILAH